MSIAPTKPMAAQPRDVAIMNFNPTEKTTPQHGKRAAACGRD